MDVSVHRALAEPSRARLLELLEGADEPLATDQLAALASLHPNTVRAHLALLEDAGLVRSVTLGGGTPGRPRRMYSVVPRFVPEEHELLASALAASLEQVPDAARLARESGRKWGRFLVDRLPPDAPRSEEACVAQVEQLLARRGFSPRVVDGTIEMATCPFRELADRHPGIVCGLHAGIVEGALEELGAPVAVDGLERRSPPAPCVARLRSRS
jgi:predicted ArsR family transcriptional regulator